MNEPGVNLVLNILTLAFLVLGVVAAIPFAIGTYRKAKGAADSEVISSQEKRINELEMDNSRLAEKVLNLEKSVAALGGKLDSAKIEAAEYKALIMGEKVPEALQMLASTTALQIIGRVDKVEEDILGAILAFGTDLHEAVVTLKEVGDRILAKGGSHGNTGN